MPTRQPMLIVDGSYFLFRAYAVPFRFFSKTKKIPLHVLTAYLKLLRLVVEAAAGETGLAKIVVVFDSQQANWRRIIDSRYKSNRKKDYSLEADSPLRHYPLIKQLLDYADIANYEAQDGEADDLIASLAEKHKSGLKIYIASNDSDFYQLLAENVEMIRIKAKNNYQLTSAESLVDELGIAPEQYVFWKSLVGDRADNIVGIRGVGPKKATAFLRGSLKLDLAGHQEMLRLNQKLITLERKLPLDWIEHDLAYSHKIMASNQSLFAGVGYT